MKELNTVRKEIENTSDEEFTGSVIKDFLDQIRDLKKKARNNQIPG